RFVTTYSGINDTATQPSRGPGIPADTIFPSSTNATGYSTLNFDTIIQLVFESEFDRQKRLFLYIPASERDRYHGRFVASREGVIVDDDSDLSRLTNRVFSHGKISIYITRVGVPIRMPSPFVR